MMGRRRAQDAAMSLLSPSVPCGLSQLAVRRPNCCVWRRSLSTSTVAAPLLSRRARAPRPSYTYDRIPDGRRLYSLSPLKANIAVLGGGLTGLTTAYYLAKKLPPTAQITLYESSDRLGGWIRTERHPVNLGGKRGNVLFERGPRSLTSLHGNYWRYDDLVLYDLCLDLALRLNIPPPLPRYIFYPDHLVPVPPHISFFEMLQEPLFVQSIGAALMLWFNQLFKTSHSDEVPSDISISDWVYKLTKSRHAGDTLASAMIHGIYGGDIDKLSVQSVLDRFFWGWELPEGPPRTRLMPKSETDILKTLGKDKQIQGMALAPKGQLVDFGAAGMQSLTDALAAALEEQKNVTIKLNSPIIKIEDKKEEEKIQVTSGDERPASYDKVISTMSAQNLFKATSDNLPTLAEFETVDIMTVNLWFPDEDLKPPGTGYLIPRTVWPEVNPEHVLGVFFDSDVQVRGPDEPAGTKLFVLMGGHYYGRPSVSIPSEEEAIEQARSVLERHLGIGRDRPCYAVASLAKDAIPQHNVGHQSMVDSVHDQLVESFGGRLAVAGGSYTRIGTVAALRAGYDIAQQMTKENWLDVTGLDEYAKNPYAFTYKPKDEIPVRGKPILVKGAKPGNKKE